MLSAPPGDNLGSTGGRTPSPGPRAARKNAERRTYRRNTEITGEKRQLPRAHRGPAGFPPGRRTRAGKHNGAGGACRQRIPTTLRTSRLPAPHLRGRGRARSAAPPPLAALRPAAAAGGAAGAGRRSTPSSPSAPPPLPAPPAPRAEVGERRKAPPGAAGAAPGMPLLLRGGQSKGRCRPPQALYGGGRTRAARAPGGARGAARGLRARAHTAAVGAGPPSSALGRRGSAALRGKGAPRPGVARGWSASEGVTAAEATRGSGNSTARPLCSKTASLRTPQRRSVCISTSKRQTKPTKLIFHWYRYFHPGTRWE